MKTIKELADIGVKACLNVNERKLYGNLCVHERYGAYASDRIFREAFAQAVRDAVMADLVTKSDSLPDPYAELKAAHARGESIEVFIPDDEYGSDRWSLKQNESWSGGPDRYRIKPSPTFDLHGKTWTRHTPGDPRPCGENGRVHILCRGDTPKFKGDRSGYNWDWGKQSEHQDSEIIGWRYADKPTWTLPAPPEGREWHRTDWTEDMLPEGYRPALLGEKQEIGDEWLTGLAWSVMDEHCICEPSTKDDPFSRTRRPLPPVLKTIPLDINNIRATDEFRLRSGNIHILPLKYACEAFITIQTACSFMDRSYQELAANYIRRQHGSTEWLPCTKEVAA